MTSSFSKRVKNPAVALQAAEQSLHFVASLVHFPVVLSGTDPIGLGWDHRHEAKQSNDADHAALALSNNALPTMHCATRER